MLTAQQRSTSDSLLRGAFDDDLTPPDRRPGGSPRDLRHKPYDTRLRKTSSRGHTPPSQSPLLRVSTSAVLTTTTTTTIAGANSGSDGSDGSEESLPTSAELQALALEQRKRRLVGLVDKIEHTHSVNFYRFSQLPASSFSRSTGGGSGGDSHVPSSLSAPSLLEQNDSLSAPLPPPHSRKLTSLLDHVKRGPQLMGVNGKPALHTDEIRGLEAVKNKLRFMIGEACFGGRFSDLYSSNRPPERKMYVTSPPGSGVCTLLFSYCAEHGINLVRVSIAADCNFQEDFFKSLFEYTRMVMPCVLLFDRCGPWFMRKEVDHGLGYPIRGEKFMLALEAVPTIKAGTENVWMVFSMTEPPECCHEVFSNWLGPNVINVGDATQEVRTLVFADTLRRMLVELLLTKAAEADEEMREYLDSAHDALLPHCDRLSERHPSFTPGMVHEYCQHVIALARQRAINKTASAGGGGGGSEGGGGDDDNSFDLIDGIPGEGDFNFADVQIAATVPGQIVWKRFEPVFLTRVMQARR